MTALTIIVIVILGAMLVILALGLPLLLPKGSLIPDMIGLGMLAAIVLAFVWLTAIWWVLLPILAVGALIAWMDRKPEEPPYPETGMSDRTRARFKLWRTANRITIILLAIMILSLANRGGAAPFMHILVPLLLVTTVASSAFRFSYNRSIPREASAISRLPATTA